MKIKLTILSQQLTKEDLQNLLQGIRDCEIKYFPNKELSILIEVPELTTAECTEILTSIKPPYKYGPLVGELKGREESI